MKTKQIKVRLDEKLFRRMEDCREDLIEERGVYISRSEFIRAVFRDWDKLADIRVEEMMRRHQRADGARL